MNLESSSLPYCLGANSVSLLEALSFSQETTLTTTLSPLHGTFSRKFRAGMQNSTPTHKEKCCAEGKGSVGIGGEQGNRELCLVKLGTLLVRMVRLCYHSSASNMGNRLKCGPLKPSHVKGLLSVILKL